MRFSIVIPTSNRAKQVVALIEQLLKQNYSKRNFEIIIVYNGIVDDTLVRLNAIDTKGCSVRIVESSHSSSAARNCGYQLAKFQHIVFLDDDVCVNAGFLTSLEKAWKKYPDASLISGRVLPEKRIWKRLPVSNSKATQLLGKYHWIFSYVDYGKKPLKMGINSIICGALFCVNKRCIPIASALFDTRFGKKYFGIPILAEDYEFSNRLTLERKNVWYVPEIFCYHAFNPDRFKKKYVIKRHLIAGAENYLMESVLCSKYSQYKTYTKTYYLWNSFKKICHGHDDRYFHKFKDPMSWIFFLGYFLFGPLLYKLAR